MRQKERREKGYRVAMRDLEQAMKWGSKKDIHQAIEHAIKADLARFDLGLGRKRKRK